jgi:hypothetical protein
MGNETGDDDDDHARQPTDEEPPAVDEPKEPGVELKATPAGSNAKGKGSKCSDKQAKALKALQINGSFAFNKASTTTAPYVFRGGSSHGAGGSASSNPASTNKPSNKSQQPVSKTPNKPAPKSQKKPAVKKAQPKAKKPATPKPKAVPKQVIDLEEEDGEEETTVKQSNDRVSRSGKTASIQPLTVSTASSKILEEINQATEAARQELLVLRREKESVERAHKDFKRAQLKADKDEQEKRQKSKNQNVLNNSKVIYNIVS